MTTLRVKPARIPLDVSHDMKREFKAATAIKGEKMMPVLIRFIRAYIGREREELDRLIEAYKNKGLSH